MLNLIDATIKNLIDSEHPEYVQRSQIGHAHKDSVVVGMAAMAMDKKNQSYLAMVQALFESGFLSTSESCFNLSQLWEYIYGVKMHTALGTFLKLFDELVSRSHIAPDHKTAYNPSGDNYYCAMQFQIKPDEDDIKVREISANHFGSDAEPFRTDVFRKVIIIENQSPTYAVILDYSIWTNEPAKLHFMRLKEDYSDSDVLTDLIEREFDIADNYQFTSYGGDKKICKIITTLDVDSLGCKPVVAPHTIEHVLFNIYSGYDALSESAAIATNTEI